ncbi:hypothetical protein ACFWWT_38085 [Streptomyces sp. NPDC058676]|uniref:AfsR/SARP family transcriptional regulator n=1 Tax=unclassified Streptomyces TaxID=2593676 RepID=UPI00365BD8FC
MRTPAPPRHHPQSLHLLAVLTAAITLTATTTPHADATTPSTTPSPATSAPLTINESDPDLALPPGTTLATVKVLDLHSPRRDIQQIVEADPRATPGGTPPHPTTTHRGDQPSPQPSHAPDATTAPAPPTSSASALPPPQPPLPSTSSFAPPTRQPSDAPSPTSHTPALPALIGVAALLAALATALLALRRLAHHRRRTHQHTATTQRRGGKAAPQAGTDTHGAAGVARLDLALRTLAHTAARNGEHPLPALRAARIGPHLLEILPDDDAHPPPAPFTQGQDRWWQLADDAPLLHPSTARTIPAPYPGLVTLGTTEPGTLLLLNLTHLPALLLNGGHPHITEVCTSLALEAATSPLNDGLNITAVGFGEELHHLLPGLITHHQPAHALKELTERLLETHQSPHPHPRPHLMLCATDLDLHTAAQLAALTHKRGTTPITLIAPTSPAATHFPHAPVLNARADTPQHLDLINTHITLQRLPHAAYQQITTTLTTLEPSAQPGDAPQHKHPDEPPSATPSTPRTNEVPSALPGNRRPRAASHQPDPHAEPSNLPAAAHPTADETNTEIYPALLEAAQQSPHPPHTTPTQHHGQGQEKAQDQGQGQGQAQDQGQGEHPGRPAGAPPTARPATPPSPQGTQAPHSVPDPHAPQIRVLGPVEVDRVKNTGHGPRIAQLAALLYFRPGRTADTLCTDMDPHNPWTTSTLNARLQGLRHALGNDRDGHPYVPRRRTSDDPYRLSPTIRCDWTHFQHLTQQPTALPQLEEALNLVRGRPFGHKPPPWAEPYQQEMTSRIIHTAHLIATHRTPPGPHHNLSKARQAITTGLDIDPTSEELYRDWMRIEYAAHNRQGLYTAITRVQQVTQALNCPLQTETEHLIDELLNPPPPNPPPPHHATQPTH